jgi:hypothetical protein
MTIITDYYGIRKGTTYLDIYEQPDDGEKPIVHRRLKDDDAYDTWHLSMYFKEILSYKRLLDRRTFNLSDIPRKEKNLLLYLLMAAFGRTVSVMELGSSLFELIDGLEAVNRYFADRAIVICGEGETLSPKKQAYTGIELSELLRYASEKLHPGFTINTLPDAGRLTGQYDICFSRMTTSYAFTEVSEYTGFLKHSSTALLNSYFSLGDTFITGAVGKSLTFFSLKEFLEKVDKPFYHLFGFEAPGHESGNPRKHPFPVVQGFFLMAPEETAGRFMDLAGKEDGVDQYFREKEIRLSPAETLLVRQG